MQRMQGEIPKPNVVICCNSFTKFRAIAVILNVIKKDSRDFSHLLSKFDKQKP